MLSYEYNQIRTGILTFYKSILESWRNLAKPTPSSHKRDFGAAAVINAGAR